MRQHKYSQCIYQALVNFRLTDCIEQIELDFSCSSPQALEILTALQWGGLRNA